MMKISRITKRYILGMAIVIIVFMVGIYLQDLKHRESTAAAWKANRFNMARFEKIREYTDEMSPDNWLAIRDSIRHQLDSLMILSFRKDIDSLKEVRKSQNDNTKVNLDL